MKHPFFVFLVAVSVLTGCATTATTGADQATSGVQSRGASDTGRFASLRKGMSVEELVGLVGQPEKRQPFPSVTGKDAEMWTYRVVLRVEEGNVPIATKEVPFIDPITGAQRMISETVYSVETLKTERVYEMLVVSGTLLEWKTKQETQRSIL